MNIKTFGIVLFGYLSLSACTHTNETSQKPADPSSVSEGWSDVKSGSKEMARGVGDKAESAGESVASGAAEVASDMKEGTAKAGVALKSAACPVVANQVSRRYYTKNDKDYPSVLAGEKVFAKDDRECFFSEQAAMESGYQKAR